jgi:hypothetical protein
MKLLGINDWIYLKLQPYRQISISKGRNQKLAPRYYGPFEIVDHIGTIAYRLCLSFGSTIHPIFHVAQLKKHVHRSTPLFPPSTSIVVHHWEARNSETMRLFLNFWSNGLTFLK